MLSASAFGRPDNTYLDLDYSVYMYYQENLIEQLFSMEQGMVHWWEPSPSYQCGPVSNLGINTMCGLSLLLILSFAPRDFSPVTCTPVLPSPQKPSFLNSNSTRKGRRRTSLSMEIQSVQTVEELVHSLCILCKEEDLQAYMYIYVTGQIWFHINFDLT